MGGAGESRRFDWGEEEEAEEEEDGLAGPTEKGRGGCALTGLGGREGKEEEEEEEEEEAVDERGPGGGERVLAGRLPAGEGGRNEDEEEEGGR